MAKHSKGPWKLDDYGPKSGNVIRFEVNAANGERICELEDPEIEPGGMPADEATANAELIVAAPDLYEACRLALSTCVACGIDNATVRMLRRAISKAEGN